jgi:hypothetical protein
MGPELIIVPVVLAIAVQVVVAARLGQHTRDLALRSADLPQRHKLVGVGLVLRREFCVRVCTR